MIAQPIIHRILEDPGRIGQHSGLIVVARRGYRQDNSIFILVCIRERQRSIGIIPVEAGNESLHGDKSCNLRRRVGEVLGIGNYIVQSQWAQSRNLVKSGFSTSLSYPIPENIVDLDWLSFQLGVK